MANLSAFGGAQPITPGGLVALGHTDITSAVVVTSTTGQNIGGSVTAVCDGSPVVVEMFCPYTVVGGIYLVSSLYVDGSFQQRTSVQVSGTQPMYAKVRLTPSAGTHTFQWSALVNTSSATMQFDTAPTVNGGPGFLRVSKIVQQNDGLKPFWTPPLVTQLPTNPTVGDTVIYAADATDGVYWNLYYDGIGSYPWKYVGGPPLLDFVSAAGQTSTSSSYTALATAGPTLTLPLAGDYDVNISAQTASTAAAHYAGFSSYDVGATAANDAWAVMFGVNYGPGYGSNADRTYRHTGLAASTSLVAKYRTPQSVQVYFNERILTATPVRVAA